MSGLPTPTNVVNRALILRLATRHRLPVAYHLRFFTTEGGLMSYGVNNIDSIFGTMLAEAITSLTSHTESH